MARHHLNDGAVPVPKGSHMFEATSLDHLIEQHRLAREHYHLCKHQERSGDTITGASDRDALARADLAWQKAESALWQQRSPFDQPSVRANSGW